MAKSFCKAQVLGSVGADPAITTLSNCRLMASIHIAVAVTLFDATVSQNVERIVWHRIVALDSMREYPRQHHQRLPRICRGSTVSLHMGGPRRKDEILQSDCCF